MIRFVDVDPQEPSRKRVVGEASVEVAAETLAVKTKPAKRASVRKPAAK